MATSPNTSQETEVTHEGFTSGGGLNWNTWTSGDNN